MEAYTAKLSSSRRSWWYIPQKPCSLRQSWVELVCEFVARFGFIGAFITKGMPMARMTRKLKTFICKVFEAQGHPFQSVSHTTHLQEFFGGSVAGFVGVMKLQHPDVVWAVLLNATGDSRRSLDCKRLWVPDLSCICFSV